MGDLSFILAHGSLRRHDHIGKIISLDSRKNFLNAFLLEKLSVLNLLRRKRIYVRILAYFNILRGQTMI